jgi:hypothetical protein
MHEKAKEYSEKQRVFFIINYFNKCTEVVICMILKHFFADVNTISNNKYQSILLFLLECKIPMWLHYKTGGISEGAYGASTRANRKVVI